VHWFCRSFDSHALGRGAPIATDELRTVSEFASILQSSSAKEAVNSIAKGVCRFCI